MRRRLVSMNKRKLLTGPYLVWAVAFILIPLAVILYYGLTGSDGHFTFENILAIGTVENFKALCLSLLLSFISTLICLVLAYPLAMMLSNMKVSQTSFMVLIFILPMWMNFLLRTMAWQTLLEKNGVINQILSFSICPPYRSSIHRELLSWAWSTTFCPLWCCLCIMYYPKLTGILSWQPEIWEPLLSIPSGRSFFP